MEKIIKEKKHRLDRELYKGYNVVSFTLCVDGRGPLFTDRSIADKFLEILRLENKKNKCKNIAYVFMPDHLHLIQEGIAEDSDVWKAIVDFKQKTGFWMSKNSNFRWQKDFYDYIHRKKDDIKVHVNYVFENPVRKQLATDFTDYKLLGSLDYKIEEIIH